MTNVVDMTQFRLKKLEEAVPEDNIDYNEHMSIDMVYDILDFLEDEGLDIRADPKIMYDIIMVAQSINGLLCRIDGEPHRAHELAELVVSIENPEEALNQFLS
jgi:hypothetical protein